MDREKAVMQDVEQNAAIEMETEPKAVNAALSETK